jgi:hypothetical protein
LVRVAFPGIHPTLGGSTVTKEPGLVVGRVVSVFPDPEIDRTGVFAFLRNGMYKGGDQVVCEGVAGEVLA